MGHGCGKQVELIKKLHPDLCFFLFDIPPQLYVSEQYLSAVFPGSVVSYEETRKEDYIPRIEKGKIYIFGNYKFPIINQIDVDLFWNAASFQEMEPDVVSHYLKFVNCKAKYAYLQEKMDGKELNSEIGRGGVLKRTTLPDYIKGLSNFELVDLSACNIPSYKLFVSPFSEKVLKAGTELLESLIQKVAFGKEELTVKGYKDSFWQSKSL